MAFRHKSFGWLVSLGFVVAIARGMFGDDPTRTAAPSRTKNIVGIQQASREISVLEANTFHAELLRHVGRDLHEQVQLDVRYDGILGQEVPRGSSENRGQMGFPVQWSICADRHVLFSFRLSVDDRNAIAHTEIERRTLYLKVCSIDGYDSVIDEALDAAQPDLGGLSIRDFLTDMKNWDMVEIWLPLRGPPGR